MVHLITFATSKFDVAAETPNPINPIAGQGVLLWLRERLSARGFTANEPDAEDWGWYMDVGSGDDRYLVGASGEGEVPGAEVEWTVQIHKRRSFMDRILGRNALAVDNALSQLIEQSLCAEVDVRDIQVDRNAE